LGTDRVYLAEKADMLELWVRLHVPIARQAPSLWSLDHPQMNHACHAQQITSAFQDKGMPGNARLIPQHHQADGIVPVKLHIMLFCQITFIASLPHISQ